MLPRWFTTIKTTSGFMPSNLLVKRIICWHGLCIFNISVAYNSSWCFVGSLMMFFASGPYSPEQRNIRPCWAFALGLLDLILNWGLLKWLTCPIGRPPINSDIHETVEHIDLAAYIRAVQLSFLFKITYYVYKICIYLSCHLTPQLDGEPNGRKPCNYGAPL